MGKAIAPVEFGDNFIQDSQQSDNIHLNSVRVIALKAILSADPQALKQADEKISFGGHCLPYYVLLDREWLDIVYPIAARAICSSAQADKYRAEGQQVSSL